MESLTPRTRRVAAALVLGLLVTSPTPVAGRALIVDGAHLIAAVTSLSSRQGTGAGGRSPDSSQTSTLGPASDPLPACRYRDVLTRYHHRYEWRITLLDTILRLRRSYAPSDLVSVRRAGIGGSGKVRRVVIGDLRAIAAAARAAGKAIAVRSAYRSYADQVATFNAWVQQMGYERALLYAARPGHSEHQLGTTIDVRSANSAKAPWDYDDWGDTPAGRWMRRNSWKYGFILSYPEGMRRQTCYAYEPWHFRYVGRPQAKLVHDSGETLRRYLWENHETAP